MFAPPSQVEEAFAGAPVADAEKVAIVGLPTHCHVSRLDHFEPQFVMQVPGVEQRAVKVEQHCLGEYVRSLQPPVEHLALSLHENRRSLASISLQPVATRKDFLASKDVSAPEALKIESS